MKEPRARKLATIAAWIAEHRPELEVEVRQSYTNTDHKVGRLRWPGKGRRGNRLIVKVRDTGLVVLDHDSSQTYRNNREVERWLADYLESKRKVPGGP